MASKYYVYIYTVYTFFILFCIFCVAILKPSEEELSSSTYLFVGLKTNQIISVIFCFCDVKKRVDIT